MATVLIPLADGFEEIEAVTVIDLLRRAGIDVVAAGLAPGAVRGSHGIAVETDATLDEALERDYDMVVLPGGLPGADNLEADERVRTVLRRLADSGRFTAAICAAPKVLAAAGLLEGRRATSFPGFLDPAATPGLELSEAPVVQDGRVITSRGPGTAMDFALALVENLAGSDARREDVGRDAAVMDRAARRRVITRGGELDGAALGQRHHGLHRALAESLLARDNSATVILQRARHNFRGRSAALVDQHDDPRTVEDVAFMGLIGKIGVGYAAARGNDQAIIQKPVRHIDGRIQNAARVVP